MSAFAQKNYENDWKKIDSLVDIGQPKTALEIADRIYSETKTSGNSVQNLKAVLYRMKLKADYEEDAFVKLIADNEKEIAAASFPEKNVLYSYQAELYWKYYEQNRYKFLDRTQIVDFVQDNIETWDLKKISEKCIEYYFKSLENYAELQKIDISKFNDILIAQPESRFLRPTLYDLLAHRAIDFFMNTETGLTRPADAFYINNEKYFADAADFSVQNIDTRDSNAFAFLALKLFQQAIQFHLADKDPSALVDLDLKRLAYVNSNSTLAGKQELYIAALAKLESRYKNHPSSTDVSFALAQQWLEKGNKYNALQGDAHKWDKKQAYTIANDAVNRFPDAFGAKNCASLMKQIEEKSLEVNTDYATVPGLPALALVSYTNISKLNFRIIKVDPETDRNLTENGTDDAFEKYSRMKPLQQWSVTLPGDGDYQKHSCEIKIPAMEPGMYVIMASEKENYDSKFLNSLNRIWFTGISYVNKRRDNGSYDLYVVDRNSGSPLPKVKVQQFFREYNYQKRKYDDKAGDVFYTDNNGFVKLPKSDKSNQSQFYLKFTGNRDFFYTDQYFYSYGYSNDEERAVVQTRFFTDRAIYRPGQTIYFKGIVTESKGRDVKIKSGYRTKVTLLDANWQEVSSMDVIANEYGSFAGNFTAPQGGLTGRMTLQCETGQQEFQVEEYKRPKFEVNFKPVTGTYKLGEKVIVTGKAMAFAGNSLSDANVTYRVVRTASFPYRWCFWYFWLPPVPEMEITNGTVVSDEKGEFKIEFTAIPDLTVSEDFKPIFNYTVHAQVTDINGESHDAETSVAVSKQALMLNTDARDIVSSDEELKFEVNTTNLNGSSEPATVEISIWKLETPDVLKRDRNWDRPDKFVMSKIEFEKDFPLDLYKNENEMQSWKKIKPVFSKTINTATDSIVKTGLYPENGSFVLELKTIDKFGETIENKVFFKTWSLKKKQIPALTTLWHQAPSTAEAGSNISLLYGSSFKNVFAVYEKANLDGVNDNSVENINDLQNKTISITDADRGNIGLNMFFVKNNRTYNFSDIVSVPYTDNMLDVEIASFRDKLLPGASEEWSITIKDKKGEKMLAELLAGMYDASLDEFVAHNWYFNLWKYYYNYNSWDYSSSFGTRSSMIAYEHDWYYGVDSRQYDRLNDFGLGYFGYYGYAGGDGRMLKMAMPSAAKGEMEVNEQSVIFDVVAFDQVTIEKDNTVTRNDKAKSGKGDLTRKTEKQNSSQPTKIRTNFNETAFFFPQVSTNEKGEAVIKFTMPESLTRWKFMSLAHTKDLKSGMFEKTLVTQKDLMVVPNVPRFLREGDEIEIATKISNLSDGKLNGTATLQLFDAYTMQPVMGMIKSNADAAFEVNKDENTSVSWKILVPEGLQAVVYRISATAGMYTDGEENALPVLSNRMLVTESLPLPVNGNQTKTFALDKLVQSGNGSSTLRNYRLTLEFSSNPAWYAVQALLYLMEYPYECAEQTFSRFYANSLASFIANSSPKIKQVFDSWKNITPDALKSNLEKNEELKNVLLQESPWVRDAQNESERKQRIALLFDFNKMSGELESALRKLSDMQASNGGWPWFPGMPDNRYITQHIVTGLNHLKHLGVLLEDDRIATMLSRATYYLDDRMVEEYNDIKKYDKKYLSNDHLSDIMIQYLYARSYNLQELPMEKSKLEAFEYFKKQAATYWKTRNNYMKGMIALALNRFDDTKTASLIMRSLSETALHSDEMGMYWRNETRGWYWAQAPVETQALLIEAFDEVANDQKSVEEMKIWLLKQKQTQDWKTTKATTEAIYALLLRGTDLLASDKLAVIKVGKEVVDPMKADGANKPEAGTGYFKTSWTANEITPAMGSVTVTNPNPTVAWGALYWQYFEQLDKITSADSPLKINKKLFKEINTETGPVIQPISENNVLNVGDKVVVRVELFTDRDMEYVHLKDMRAAGFEPVNVLSGYRWQGGLGYYESTRDASTNFFISYLPKGTYVFEYKLVVSQRGTFSNGITTAQCMYAPEFSSHSEGIKVKVE